MKKIYDSLLAFILISLAIPEKKVESQVAAGFISVASDCYTFGTAYPFVLIIPEDVGDSNNCTPSKGICADNDCPEGTLEAVPMPE